MLELFHSNQPFRLGSLGKVLALNELKRLKSKVFFDEAPDGGAGFAGLSLYTRDGSRRVPLDLLPDGFSKGWRPNGARSTGALVRLERSSAGVVLDNAEDSLSLAAGSIRQMAFGWWPCLCQATISARMAFSTAIFSLPLDFAQQNKHKPSAKRANMKTTRFSFLTYIHLRFRTAAFFMANSV